MIADLYFPTPDPDAGPETETETEHCSYAEFDPDFVADVDGFFSFLRTTNELRSLVPEIYELVAIFNALDYNPRIWDFETASFVISNKT